MHCVDTASTLVLPEGVDSIRAILLVIQFSTDLEQPQRLYSIQFVECEAVVDASRNDKKIAGQDVNADPLV